MWIKISTVLSLTLVPFICVQGQSIRWTKDQVVAVYGGNQKLSCVSPQQPTFVKNNKTITTTPDKYEISVAPQVNLFHLQVLNIVDSDHGSYYCVLGEQRVKIILNIGLFIPDPQPEYKAAEGDKAVIKAAVHGFPRPSVEWTKKNPLSSVYELVIKRSGTGTLTGPGSADGRFDIDAVKGYLIISPVKKSDGGDYKVKGEDSSSGHEFVRGTKLTVGDKPKITVNGKPKNSYAVTEGQPLTIPCAFVKAPTKHEWKLNLTDGQAGNVNVSATGRVKLIGTSLHIAQAQQSDKGSYVCIGSNEFGTTKAKTQITAVIIAPKIQTLNNVTKNKGSKVVLNCTAKGSPKPRVYWKKDSVSLTGQSEGYSVYTISSLQDANRGKYTCEADNGATEGDIGTVAGGKAKIDTRSIHVIVLSGATIDKNMTTTMETQKLVKGQKATLTCKAYGFPLPKIVFTKDGKELAGAKQGGSNEQSIAMSLEYSVKNSSDFGTVVCTASNIFGNESHDIKVEEIVKPGKPRNLQDSQKKTDSIRLSWDAPTSTGGGEISQYIINITDANSVSPREVTSKGTEKIIDNLMKGAEYTFSVAAENEAGLGDYSDSRKVTTYKYGKPAEVTGTGKESFPTSIHVTWKRPSDIGGAPKDSLTYTVKYCETNASPPNCKHTSKINATFVTLDGLKENTKYSITIWSRNGEQEGKEVKIEATTGTRVGPQTTERPSPKPEPKPPKGGLSGGAIAGIVIAVILIVLIVIDLFCCFFNNCGFTHCCYETFCAGQGKGKYEAAKKEEGAGNDNKDTTQLTEVKVANDEEKKEEKNNSEKA